VIATTAATGAAGLSAAVVIFIACAVEAVEALTIVLALGTTRGWRWPLAGTAGALLTLCAIVGVLGPAITVLPLDALRLVVGAVLLIVGLQWLRKAVLRAAGRKALHDEQSEYAREREAALHAAPEERRIDHYALAVAFKGVLTEGIEVVLIVVTLGAARGRIGLAALAALAAALVAAAAGAAARAPLARVPENTLKYAVGVMLCSFGVSWLGDGLGLAWPGEDAFLLALIAIVLGGSLVAVRSLSVRDAR
jgi:uncharacterized membrane protein